MSKHGRAYKKIASDQGATVGSPKAAITFAMQNDWIATADESKWLQLMKDRNLTSHTYKEETTKNVLTNIIENYIDMFSQLFNKLEKSK